MDFTKTTHSNCEVRSIIKFLTTKNKSEAEIHRRTGNESWIHYRTFEIKAGSSLGKMKNEPFPRKFKDVDGILGLLGFALHWIWYWCLQNENGNNKRCILKPYCTYKMQSRSEDTRCSHEQGSFSTAMLACIVKNLSRISSLTWNGKSSLFHDIHQIWHWVTTIYFPAPKKN